MFSSVTYFGEESVLAIHSNQSLILLSQGAALKTLHPECPEPRLARRGSKTESNFERKARFPLVLRLAAPKIEVAQKAAEVVIPE